MTYFNSISIQQGPHLDAFGRFRVSNPVTLFDAKQIHDNLPRIFDDSEVSGGSTTSVHSTATASTTMGVAATTAGKRVRQSFMRFNYHPGKSHLIFLTGVFDASGGGTGITRSIGYFDDDNGIFFRDLAGVMQVVERSSTSGSAVDTAVAQSAWNLDKMDGTGNSGITLDFTKEQIMVLDMSWLGSGPPRFGWKVGLEIVYCHEGTGANSIAVPYMSTPNLPIRYEIENDGAGAASTMLQTCSSVMSEGGAQEIGTIRRQSTAGTHLDANVINTLYAMIGLRLKTTHLDAVVKELTVSSLAMTGDDYEWVLMANPTVAGTFTYSDETNSAVQTAKGVTANTVTGGVDAGGGWAKGKSALSEILDRAIHLGSAIDGTRDTRVLCIRPISGNLDIQGSITWRELI